MIGKVFAAIPAILLVGYTWLLINVFEHLIGAINAGAVIGFALFLIILLLLGIFVYPFLVISFLIVLAEG